MAVLSSQIKKEEGDEITIRKWRRFWSFFLSLFFAGILGLNQAEALTDDEKNNIAIYQKASPSVVNIISTVITRDFFFNPIPPRGQWFRFHHR